MLTAEFTAPGGWLAAVIPGRLAAVHLAEPDAAFAQRLWAALCDDDGISLVLDELTMNGLATTPGFVLAEWNGAGSVFDGRFIVRGDSSVTVDAIGGGGDVTARGVSTWAERPLSGFRGFRVECTPADTAPGPALPLIVGSAWVSALGFGSLAGAYASAPDGIPATEWAPAAPTPVAPVEDIDRTIADLEVPAAGIAEQAAEPSVAPTAEVPAEPVAEAPDASGHAPQETTAYDHLFGATLMRHVEDAAARPVEQADEEDPAEPVQPAGVIAPLSVPETASVGTDAGGVASQALGDHDGLTVLSGDLRALRESASVVAVGTGADASEPGFTLQLPNGGAEPIDGMVVVGRAPSVSKMGGGRVPRLVTVDSADHDISRNHVQLTIEGGTVVVTDLHSRNGTVISLPGKDPQKLRAGEPTSVIAGTVIDLGSGVTLGVVQV